MPREPSPRRPTCSAGQSPTTCGAQLVHQLLSPHTLMQPRAHLGATRRALLPARGPHSRPPRQRTGEPLQRLAGKGRKNTISRRFHLTSCSGLFCHTPLDAPEALAHKNAHVEKSTQIALSTPHPTTCLAAFQWPPSRNHGLLMLALAAPDAGTATGAVLGRVAPVQTSAGPGHAIRRVGCQCARVPGGPYGSIRGSGEVRNGCSRPLSTWGDE